MSVLKIVVLAATAFSAVTQNFNYDRCDTKQGPLYWGTLSGAAQCGTPTSPQAEGTPIDLCGAVPFTGSAPTFTVSGYDTPRVMRGSNNGYSLYAGIVDNAPTLTLGTIATIVGRTNNASVQTWILEQIHPHWGRSGLVNEGSEHYKQGSAFPFEAHLVHYNGRFSSFSAAVSSGASDALLVVGVFYSIGNSDTNLTATWANTVSTLTKNARAFSTNVILSDMFNGTGAYYSYKGALTTPGCNQIVTWVVMKEPKSITLAALNKFKAASTNPSSSSRKFVTTADALTYGTYGNYRPLQPINGRVIYSSDGATDVCGSIVEAQKTCTSNGIFFGPSLAVNLLGLFFILANKL